MKNILITIIVIAGLIGLSYVFGWIGVHQTKTIGKAKKNAETEVYYETQAFVASKKREALKVYKEYVKADDDDKVAIQEMVAYSFAEFDETKLDGKVRTFIYNCKYNPK